ncbi:MAG: hypothetical protein ABW184_13950 [Sphingobium sp.]
MTEQSMVTIVAPIKRSDAGKAQEMIHTHLRNPALREIRHLIAPEGQMPFLHFASFHAVESSDGTSAFLVLEFSADGLSAIATRQLAERLGSALTPIFALATDWPKDGDIVRYLLAHRIAIGHRLGDTVGLAFSGTPGKSVIEIDQEEQLARRVGVLLEKQAAGLSPLGRLHHIRATLREHPGWRWALETPPPPIAAPASEPTIWTKARTLFPRFLATFAWPFLLALGLLGAVLLWPDEGAGILGWLWFLFELLLFASVGLVVVIVAIYLAFRKGEDADWISDRAPDAAMLDQIFARENPTGHVQNHMLSITVLKPGIVRKLTIRLAFWAIANLTRLNPKPGHLGDIGTIHFARWVNLPGTRDLLFFSNFGGSWESYLEDFITKAHEGLTGVWSNTVGFPRTRNLFLDGATDGERFKRYARQSMVYTAFWYCAYPGLTTANIRTNALVRRGLATAMSEDEAVRWLALFGSTPRPVEKLETTQIQSIVFGGLGFKPEGTLVTVALSHDVAANRKWLAAVLPSVAFNDGRYAPQSAVLTLAASAAGLAALGLPKDGLATFPAAFTAGMCGPGRDRILGDLGANAAENWRWGKDGDDIALLIYGSDAAAVETLRAEVVAHCAANGARITHEFPLAPVGKTVSDRIEPFGFVDGVSQPAIRGTYRGLRNDDPIHLVEPGEFVLGYPDNRGNVPPGPMLGAAHDPDLRLPIAGTDHGFSECIAENPRLIGHNGSFLVIRQLEQHVDTFEAYCAGEAERIGPYVASLPVDLGHEALTEYVGAKMIGRWKDGSSLVRYPYMSASRLKAVFGKDQSEGASRPEAHPTDPAATPIKAADARGSDRKSAIRPDNDFLFGTEDPQGLRCPYGAHVRRANPRDSLEPGSNEQIAIANRHRILRVGRGYEDGDAKGLMFMCLAGDIERQFEFIQQTWMGSTKFHGLDLETDPIVSDGVVGRCGFTIPTRAGPIALKSMPQFVTMRGGGYFFVPGKQLLDWLATR